MFISAEQAVKQKARYILSKGWVCPIMSLGVMLILIFLYVEMRDLSSVISTDFFGLDSLSLGDINLFSDFSLSALSKLLPLFISIALEFLIALVTLFLSPFINGYLKLYYSAIKNEKYEISDLIYFFHGKRFFKTLGMNLSFFFRLLIPGILIYLPVIIYVSLCLIFFSDFIQTGAYTAVLVILIILSSLMLLLYSLKYFLTFKLYCDDDTKKISSYFRDSKTYMYERTNDVIRLTWSLLPWILLSLLLLPMLYTLPYITQSYCVCANYLIDAEKDVIHNDESIPVYNSVQ